MTDVQGLFGDVGEPRLSVVPAEVEMLAAQRPDPSRVPMALDPGPDARLLEVYARAVNPQDPIELRDLYLGRVECELGVESHRPDLAARWRQSRRRREVDAAAVLNSRATVRFVKELFNSYFRDDLYGDLRSQAGIILSSGSVDEEHWGLPGPLKDCIAYALNRDWYGYSDSRGREPAREAVAAYEAARLPSAGYTADNVALTMGATLAISTVVDFILLEASPGGAASLCAIPNYPPLVESVARRGPVSLVPLSSSADGRTSLRPLIDALRPDTPIVLLQTAANPTGALVCEDELELLIKSASPNTLIVLDECHEWLGEPVATSPARAAANVIRVSSLSKNWSAPGLKVGWLMADSGFIDRYYEYASTTFGGPPSFFYTVVEVLARMERWLVSGDEELTPAHCREFESTYGLRLPGLQRAYDNYRVERRSRERSLTLIRDAYHNGIRLPGVSVLPARYSINLTTSFDDHEDSYLCFRELLRETNVSLFPGILTFCLSGAFMRLTTSRPWSDYAEAMPRLRRYQEREVRPV
ncbi:pyridoxal phosphate-dependent aminotransferase [Micromonospora sp. NPDC020750]|uniref:pyridoxal phosphate-dependent aminotransferase n=1 Tax=unclassified Micromonospora TaxID=2617518 RepID=UPI0037B8AB4F